MFIAFSSILMRRQLRRADTTARLRAENAGATPEAAAQIKSGVGLDGYRAKPERENDGKNGDRHEKHCDRARMAAERTLAFGAFGLE
ncbi:hypothetical protein QNH14_23035 (plasmid) [Apirhabdus apintestini]|nr:hypothetical protein QNH14_23035 [Enterobacteriaceae bacterium CA-0114]